MRNKMKTGTTLGIGLIGAGAIARLAHLPVVQKAAGVRVVGFVDDNLERAGVLAEQCEGAFATNDLDRLLACPDIDAVIVATPNSKHEAAVLGAAAAGKHVLCEKPLSNDVPSAMRMVQACAAAGVILQVGFNQRYWEQVRSAKEIIDSGLIGTIYGFRSVYSERWDAYPAATAFRFDLAQSGGATIIDLAVHRIDLARYLVGDFVSVIADLSHCSIPAMVDDNVWLMAKFAGGARGTITSDRYSPAISDGTDIYGTEGTIHIATESINPFHAVPLAIYTERSLDALPESLKEQHYPEAWWQAFKGGWLTMKPPRRNPYEAQFSSFCTCIRSGGSPSPSGVDGLRAQEVVQAAYLSMRESRWIDLPLADPNDVYLPSY
jgi:predicted dehydrogenase